MFSPQEAEAPPQDQENSDKEQQEAPKVKRVLQPRPKLNAARLQEPQGLPALESVFKDVKFKGRHQEEEDLNNLMFRYEYWCNKLFPKLPFESCLEKIEQVGSDRATQTYIKKIRMGLVEAEGANQQQVAELPSNESD